MTETSVRPPLFWGPKKLPVPFAAAWSGEEPDISALIARPFGAGLAYSDERPEDRDEQGVLWARLSIAPGSGRPIFEAMHSVRQREAMLHRLCQVCGKPAERTEQGWLFLSQYTRLTHAMGDSANQGFTSKPPICPPCARLAVELCPHLTDPVVIRSANPRVWGVSGGFYVPNRYSKLVPFPSDDNLSYHQDPVAERWFLASQLIVHLTKCTPATL
ncbi:hypothetical protein [Streptomyces sp. CA-111067]|uniref:hypothetical protein n=1 Tax=Streptomyces sp. CA-111067 TaxID=3240046 RepID=UPI003D988AE4